MHRTLALLALTACATEDPCAVVEAQLTSDVANLLTDEDGTIDAQQLLGVRGESWRFVGCDEPLTVDGEGSITAHSVVVGAYYQPHGSRWDEDVTHWCDLTRYDQGLKAACNWR